MRTTISVALIATVLTAGAATEAAPQAPKRATATPVEAALNLTASSNSRRRRERRIIALTNARRTNHGCRPLREHPALRRAARRHSRQMARHETMSHRLPGEPWLGVRVRRAGYTNWQRLGENVAFGYRSPRALVRAWMNSPGHRRNILDCHYRHIGVGLIWREGVPWWTQDFGSR